MSTLSVRTSTEPLQIPSPCRKLQLGATAATLDGPFPYYCFGVFTQATTHLECR
jgi:hypothetical protein